MSTAIHDQIDHFSFFLFALHQQFRMHTQSLRDCKKRSNKHHQLESIWFNRIDRQFISFSPLEQRQKVWKKQISKCIALHSKVNEVNRHETCRQTMFAMANTETTSIRSSEIDSMKIEWPNSCDSRLPDVRWSNLWLFSFHFLFFSAVASMPFGCRTFKVQACAKIDLELELQLQHVCKIVCAQCRPNALQLLRCIRFECTTPPQTLSIK